MNESNIMNWHQLSADECLVHYGVEKDIGYSESQIEGLHKQYGLNTLRKEEKESLIMRFLKQFHHVLIYVLLAAALITALLSHWIDTFVILGVVLINALVGLIQEGKAEQALNELKAFLSPTARAIRGGKVKTIEAEKIVPGDIILLKSGDRVPADLRIIEAINLRVDESMLTGESEAVELHSEPIIGDPGLADRTNIGYAGTLVTSGRGQGVVVATGQETELGKIQDMMSGVEELTTPLIRSMNVFSRQLSVVIVIVSLSILGIGYFLIQLEPTELFLSVIALAVASIPEGLPALLSITLAIGVQKMARRNAIIRKLPAVETLGALTVICTDKTGTLTQNEMTVTQIVTPKNRYSVSGVGYEPHGEIKHSKGEKTICEEFPDLKALLESARHCNDSQVYKGMDGNWKLEGEPTEGALITLAKKGHLIERAGKRIETLPFESENKYMSVIQDFESGERRLLVKGAVEKVLSFCDLSDSELEEWEGQIKDLAGEGLRVMGFADRTLTLGHDSIETELRKPLTFLGLVGIIDPPREEAIRAIDQCQKAGITIKMITGDHAQTASAIGKRVGIQNYSQVITGTGLDQNTTDKDWELCAEKYSIFARAQPEHKLRLVEAFQRKNQIVAMTGDGVNDAPALKRADVGIAMGIKGTDVTKDAAAMVLTDDNFESIAAAVSQGRTTYSNLRKAIIFILPTNGAEALMVISSILLGFSLPITPVQLLWVNMVTAVTLALALAFEPEEKRVMQQEPRATNAPILGTYFIWRIIWVALLVGGGAIALFFYYKGHYNIDYARTIALNTLVAGQVFYLLNSRHLYESCLSFEGLFGNPKVLIAGLALLFFQMSITYAPFMQNWFGTLSITGYDWILLSTVGFVVFIAVEIEKAIYRKLNNMKNQ